MHFLQPDPPYDGPGAYQGMPRELLKTAASDVVAIVCHGSFYEGDASGSGLLLDHRYDGSNSMSRPIMLSDGRSATFRDYPFRYPPPALPYADGARPELLNLDELKVDAHSHAQMVALLGCSTAAAGTWVEDLGTLAEQWLRLGAATVLANIWESDVLVVQQWCEHFLTRWIRERQPKALAWRDANRALLSSTVGSGSLFDWACSTLWGDWI
jgi:CHAT domain-containing protein